MADIAKFARAVKVELNHTYAVLLNASNKRGLFVLTVIDYVPNKMVTLKYAVESYQVTTSAAVSSQGFQWDQKNSF